MLCSIFILWISAAAASSTTSTLSQSATASTIAIPPPSSISADEAEVAKIEKSEEDDAARALEELKNQNPFVAASPLSVAAVCSDGIALVSLHYGVDDDHDGNIDEEIDDSIGSTGGFRTVHGTDKFTNTFSSDDTESNDQTPLVEGTTQLPNHHLWSRAFRDLPISTRGPLRIEQVHSHQGNGMASEQISTMQPLPPPMAILTAGWRTDGMALASAARELMAEERMLYCLPHLAIMSDSLSCDASSATPNSLSNNLLTENANDGSENTAVRPITTPQPYYGRRIAEGLSYYMAKCEFSESTRSLSTVGLLTCGSNNSIDGEGSIFLIDATGAYSVRAHAIGAGASLLNRRMGFVNFRNMSCCEGLRALLQLVADEGGLVGSVTSSASETADPEDGSNVMAKPMSVAKQDESTNVLATQGRSRLWSITQNVATELAMIKNGDGMMRRIRLATLMSSH